MPHPEVSAAGAARYAQYQDSASQQAAKKEAAASQAQKEDRAAKRVDPVAAKQLADRYNTYTTGATPRSGTPPPKPLSTPGNPKASLDGTASAEAAAKATARHKAWYEAPLSPKGRKPGDPIPVQISNSKLKERL